MLCKAKIAVCSAIHTKHTNSTWSQCKIFACQTLWYVKLPVGFKRFRQTQHHRGAIHNWRYQVGDPVRTAHTNRCCVWSWRHRYSDRSAIYVGARWTVTRVYNTTSNVRTCNIQLFCVRVTTVVVERQQSTITETTCVSEHIYWTQNVCCDFLYTYPGTHRSCWNFITPEFSRQIFEKYSSIRFNESLSSWSRSAPCGRTDGRDEATSRFSQCYKRD